MDLYSQFQLAKQRKEQQEKDFDNNKVVILERKQVSTNNPAIAQLWIRFPKSVSPPSDLEYYFNRKKQTIEAPVHTIEKNSPFEYCIEIRSSFLMYKWMESFIQSFMQDYGFSSRGFRVKAKGYWDKYDE